MLVVTGGAAFGPLSLSTLGETLAVGVVVSVHAAISAIAASMPRTTLARRPEGKGVGQLLRSFAFFDRNSPSVRMPCCFNSASGFNCSYLIGGGAV